jgi:hypothetical protein
VSLASLLHWHPLALSISTPSLSVSASPRYWYLQSCSIGIPSSSVSASLLPWYSTPWYQHPCTIGIPSLSVSAPPCSRYQHPLALGIGILAPSASPLYWHWHPCSRGIALLGISIPSPSGLASLLPQYSIPWYWHPCSIGIPSLSVSASQVSWYRTPQRRHPSHFTIFGIRCRCPSPALGLLSTTPPQSLPPSALFPYTLPTPLRITTIPTHQPTSFIETHKHSLWNRALYSYTATSTASPINLALYLQFSIHQTLQNLREQFWCCSKGACMW